MQTMGFSAQSKRILNVATLKLSHVSSHIISIIFSEFLI